MAFITSLFEFRPDPTSDCGVICPLVFEKSIFCVVATLASLFFRWIFSILAGNKDNYTVSDEFEFRLDPTSDCAVSCPLVFEKSIFCIVATLAPSILIGSPSFLEVTMITITSWMSSYLSQIRPWTAELAALESFSVLATPASSILIRSSSFLVVTRITITPWMS